MIAAKLLNHAATGAAAAIAAIEGTSLWGQVFDEHAAIVAVFGALGGSTRWVFLRESMRDGLRLMILGALLAFGVGSLSRVLIDNYLGDSPESLLSQPQVAYNGAYLVGLFAVVLLGKWLDDNRSDGDDK